MKLAHFCDTRYSILQTRYSILGTRYCYPRLTPVATNRISWDYPHQRLIYEPGTLKTENWKLFLSCCNLGMFAITLLLHTASSLLGHCHAHPIELWFMARQQVRKARVAVPSMLAKPDTFRIRRALANTVFYRLLKNFDYYFD